VGWCGEAGRIGAEDLATASKQGFANAVAEEPIATDTDEPFGQDVLEEQSAEVWSFELGGLDAVVVPAIAIVEVNGLTVVVDEPTVGDRDLAHVAREVADHLLGAAEGTADVDVPGAARGITEALVPGVVWDTAMAFTQESLELGEELVFEDGLKDVEANEVATAVNEAFGAEPTAGDETVKVGVVSHLLIPGVEDGEDAGEESTPGCGLENRLRDRGEEGV
jgi:hypothetical protein